MSTEKRQKSGKRCGTQVSGTRHGELMRRTLKSGRSQGPQIRSRPSNAKRKANVAKHHIDFRNARRVFDGPVFEKIGSRRGEDRTFASGLMEGIAIVVVYVMRGERRRIIRQGERIAMKGRITKATSKPLAKGKSDFQRLREMRDEDIDYSDIPRLDESFWKAATLIMPEPKYRLAIPPQGRDHDVVEWLKKRGKGYQTRINAILRSYMKAQSDARR